MANWQKWSGKMTEHKGHDLRVAQWGKDGFIYNIAVACEDCYEIVVDEDVLDESDVPSITAQMESVLATMTSQ